jgi:dihydrofolate reductase
MSNVSSREPGRLVVSMNVSLDGFVQAKGQDEFDYSWMHIDEEVHRAFNELAADADAFVYGRKVYEVMIPYWPDAVGDETKPAHEREYGRMWVEKPKVVFSDQLKETRWNTRVVPTAAIEEISRLKKESNRFILCYGGPQFVSGLQQHGLVDEFALFVHQAALGFGVPLFHGRVDLTLVDVRRFENGTLRLRYAVRSGR